MNEIVKEWINKAEGDYHSAIREYRAREFPKSCYLNIKRNFTLDYWIDDGLYAGTLPIPDNINGDNNRRNF
jgi:hypothetical protein